MANNINDASRATSKVTSLWHHVPTFLPKHDIVFQLLMQHADNLFPLRTMDFGYGETTLRRRSCVFSSNTTRQPYTNVPVLPWPKVITTIKQLIEEYATSIGAAVCFDYCLAHLYPDGRATIAWHADREAIRTPIATISLGATRTFKFRPKSSVEAGQAEEVALQSGDLVWMSDHCQQQLQHCIPVEVAVQTPRISLTFRVFEL